MSIVRPATSSDSHDMVLVQIAAWRSAYAHIMPSDYLSTLDAEELTRQRKELINTGNHRVWVSEDDGQVVGYAVFGPNRVPSLPGDVELQALYVHPAAQGQGHGRQLIREGVRAEIAQGVEKLIVWSFTENVKAREFYKSIGGKHLGSSTFDIGGGTYPDEAYGFANLPKLCERLESFEIRRVGATDDLGEITRLLHRAYAKHLEEGRRFNACHQPATRTQERFDEGEGLIMIRQNKIVGTVAVKYREPLPYGNFNPDGPVACLGQFAVEPELQSLGLGYQLMRKAEQVARSVGAKYLALDTAQAAHHLVLYYQRAGFEIVGEVDYRPGTNYVSYVMAKAL